MKRHLKAGISLLLFSVGSLTAVQGLAAIEEITVTANKREQSLQDVAISVAVIGADQIQRSGIMDLIDLQSAAPSLEIEQLQSSAQTNFYIRGFGNGANNPGIEPSVGIFIDGVPRTRAASALSDLPNLERVEVLSGPQSTLFGKNSSAGVISITTKLPEDELSGTVSAGIGNYGSRVLNGTVTGPISDGLSFRLSASSNSNDGYGTNLIDGSGVNDRDRSALRGQLLWTPDEDLTVRVIVDKDTIDEMCCSAGSLRKGEAAQVSDGIALSNGRGVTSGDPWERAFYMNFEPINQLDNKGLSLQVDYDFDFATLTSLTSRRDTTMYSNFDADFSAAQLVKENVVDYEFETTTQEFRLASNSGGDIQWVVGAFFMKEDTKTLRTVKFGDEIRPYVDFLVQSLSGGEQDLQSIADYMVVAGAVQAGALPPAALGNIPATIAASAGLQAQATGLGTSFYCSTCIDPLTGATTDGGSIGENFTMESESTSFFANLDFVLTDQLSATVGINLTDDEKTVVSDVNIADSFAALPLAGSPLAALTALQFFPPFTDYPNATESGIFKSDDLTYTARLAYRHSDTLNFYVSHATGFKPISVNLSVNAASPAIGRSADPEESDAFELGMKMTFDNGYLNVAYFDQTIAGFQSNVFSGSGFALVNAGEESHKGVEFDWFMALSDNLAVNLSGITMEGDYGSYIKGPCDTNEIFPALACDAGLETRDLTGETPAGVHELSLNANVVYSFDVVGGSEGFVRLEYVYDEPVKLVNNVPESLASEDSKNLNMSVGIKNAANGWDAMFWGRNLTDHETLISAFPTTAAPGSFSAYPNQPRTYGLTVRKSF